MSWKPDTPYKRPALQVHGRGLPILWQGLLDKVSINSNFNVIPTVKSSGALKYILLYFLLPDITRRSMRGNAERNKGNPKTLDKTSYGSASPTAARAFAQYLCQGGDLWYILDCQSVLTRYSPTSHMAPNKCFWIIPSQDKERKPEG